MARQRKKPRKQQPSEPQSSGKQPERLAPGKPETDEIAVLEEARLLLARAYELLDFRSGWTRKHFARDRHSKPVSPASDRAVRFCAGGALLRAATEQLGLQLAANAKEERVADVVSDIDQLGSAALSLAYYFLARAFELLFLRAGGGHIRVQRLEDGRSQPIVVTSAAGISAAEAAGKSEVEEPTTWAAIVHGYNDHPSIKHGDIRAALLVAHMLSYGQPKESEGSEQKKSTGSES